MEDARLSELREGDMVMTPGGQLPCEPPPWLDRRKISRVRKVYKDYFASISFSHLCGLLLSFYFSKNIRTLKSTGHSDSEASLLRRYLATFRHIQSWYEGDIWNVQDPSRRSLNSVRSMHSRAAAKMVERKDGVTYFSQWDMSVTQWAFIGPIVLFPSKVGLHGCSEEDFDALVHFWRSIGYLLGVEEQFNLCSGSLSEVKEACRSMMTKEYRVKLSEADPSSVAMCEAVVAAFSKMDSALTWGSLCAYIHEMMDVPCSIAIGFGDWIAYMITHFVMVYVSRLAIMRALLNFRSRCIIEKADKRGVLKEEDTRLITHASSSG